MTESRFARVTDEELACWEKSWQAGDIAPVPAMEDVLTALRAAYEEIDRIKSNYALLDADYAAAVDANGRWQERADIRAAVIRQQDDQIRSLKSMLADRSGVIQVQRETLAAMQEALLSEMREKIADFKSKLAGGQI